jgi:hypothetical protein
LGHGGRGGGVSLPRRQLVLAGAPAFTATLAPILFT